MPVSSSGPTPACPSKPAQPSKKVIFLSAGYGCFFLTMLVFAYYGQLPIGWITRFHNADKVGHLVLYFIPSYLGHQPTFRPLNCHIENNGRRC